MIVDEPTQVHIEEDVFVFPASFAQQRLWFIDQLLPGDTLYTSPLVFRLSGRLERSHLQRSMQAIAQRHEILRTAFDVVDGQLMQVVAAQVDVPLPLIDLRSHPAPKREVIALQDIWQTLQHPLPLNQRPLFRVQLWQLQDDEHLMLVALHHIIFDEWSSGVLIRELGAGYAASVENKSAALSELPIQYADFAHWQRQWLQGEVLNNQLSYWKQQLKDIPVLQLPGASLHPSAQLLSQGSQGASQLLELPQRLLEALENLSQQAEVTLFMTLLAAFQTLLHRYTGQTDLAIGTPIANRHQSELEELIGFFVNSLVLRTNLEGDPTFLELIARVRDVALAAYDHQDLPFEKLVEELQPVRNLGQNPLFQVVFALQNTPMTQLELPGLILSPVDLETKTSRFDLEFYVWICGDNFRNLWGKGWQHADGLRGMVVYNTELFEASAIASLLKHFQTLLEGIVANPNTPLSALPLLTTEDQRELLHRWSRHQCSNSSNECIHHRFEAQVRERPDAIALQFGNQQFTYQQLNQGSNQLARYLQRLGIGTEMPVGICLERGIEAIAAMVAILKAGGVYVPLDPSYPAERLRFMVEDAGITVVLSEANWVGELQTAATTVICLQQAWDAIAQESDQNLSTLCTADRLAYVIYTSGSTGTPKGVMVPHRAVNRLVCNTDYVQITAGDRLAQVANLAFDAATFEVWGALLNGAHLIGIEREITLSPADFSDILQQQNISILFLTTALLNQTVSHIPDAFRSLKYLLFGGETANVDRVRSLVKQGKPQHLLHVYGPTENTTFSTWYEIQEILETAATIPIGRAIANTQVYVLDAHQNPVPAGVIGEIYLGGNGLAKGYLNRPKLTAEKFIDCSSGNWERGIKNGFLYRTGDRALYYPNGNLEFLGRIDNQIKIRGFRVELSEIEQAIAQHSSVQTVVVVVREIDQDRQLVAYIVSRAAAAPSERELRSLLKKRLPAYMIPAAFVVLDALPLTANGKVDQKVLPPPALHRADFSATTAPKTSLEAALVEIWVQLLGQQVGIHDNFFELGGHSLLATQFVSRVRDRLHIELPLRSIFETPTIAELAQQINTFQATFQPEFTASINAQSGANSQRREEIDL